MHIMYACPYVPMWKFTCVCSFDACHGLSLWNPQRSAQTATRSTYIDAEICMCVCVCVRSLGYSAFEQTKAR